MLITIIRFLTDTQVLIALLSAFATIATVYTLALPFFERDQLAARMKSAAIEREKIARGSARGWRPKRAVRCSARRPRPICAIGRSLQFEERALRRGHRQSTAAAGYRGQAPLVVFLFARVTLPLLTMSLALFYLFFVLDLKQPAFMKIGLALIAGYVGFYAPLLWVRNIISKRQVSMTRAWPDALDLTLICVESGMSAEAAFRRVSEEIGTQSPALAEELVLTTAELSYLQERRQAYENFGVRAGIEGVKSVMTALIQAEKYGTPIASTLRVMAQEQRDNRMNEAEKKAAALPPKSPCR